MGKVNDNYVKSLFLKDSCDGSGLNTSENSKDSHPLVLGFFRGDIVQLSYHSSGDAIQRKTVRPRESKERTRNGASERTSSTARQRGDQSRPAENGDHQRSEAIRNAKEKVRSQVDGIIV